MGNDNLISLSLGRSLDEIGESWDNHDASDLDDDRLGHASLPPVAADPSLNVRHRATDTACNPDLPAGTVRQRW